uniref:Uncharacterized protein n=1 Tax=Helicotheca tamesis TaxID=374047 RepID=A0A7S2HE95_9STRA
MGMCEGDCDSNADCDAGLICHLRNDLSEVPGCSGSGTAAWDYCVIPPILHVKLDPSATLGLCEGDCDSDADCNGGLKCYHRTAPDEPIPGCSGTGTQAWDYCVDEIHMSSYVGLKRSVDDTTCVDVSWGSICLNGVT